MFTSQFNNFVISSNKDDPTGLVWVVWVQQTGRLLYACLLCVFKKVF